MNKDQIRFIILLETERGELFNNIDKEKLEKMNLGFSWKEFEEQVTYMVGESYLTKPLYGGDTICYYNSILTEKGENYIETNKLIFGGQSMLRQIMRDTVTLIKANGEKFENIRAGVQRDKIFIEDVKLPIEEGDKIIRLLSNGLSESYLILDRGFYDRTLGMPAHYQMKVKKESAIDLEKSSSMHFNIGTVYGSNIGTQGSAYVENVFNFERVDQMIEEKGGEEKEELRKMIDEIRELFEDSEKVKKGSLSKFSGLMEKHSWISGAIAQLGLGFLTGSLFK
ncbi:hypothetical protein PMSD_17195 [Paenibacillus macquariensis subsp. defensor]|nr:hypothetical protein PMSD_17195 [Paenibacillus macquariensis subsp. defensor]